MLIKTKRILLRLRVAQLEDDGDSSQGEVENKHGEDEPVKPSWDKKVDVLGVVISDFRY